MTVKAYEKRLHSEYDEATFTHILMNHLDGTGLLYFHSGDPRRDRLKGYPDLTIVGRFILFVELKSDAGRMSLDQMRWRDKLQAAGARWTLWRPEDWENGEIDNWLEELL